MNREEIEKEILYIPINPFSKDAKPIKLNLILNDSLSKYDDYGHYIYSIDNYKKLLYYHPFPKYINISDLKFYEFKNEEEFKNYFYCSIQNKPYNKFCSECKNILCKDCKICECNNINNIKYFNEIELNWSKFEEHKNKVIKIILKLIQEFYSDKVKVFNKDEFCRIETEKIITEKVNKILNNKEYDETFNRKIRVLILDFNSLILSVLKIYNTNKYFSENYLYNLDLFEDIDFSQRLNLDDEKPKLIDENFEKYLENETFKENICSSLRNMIDFEKFLENQDEKRPSILREKRIKNIKKIDNLENFLVIIKGNYCEIYDNNGILILDRFRPSAHDIIVVSTNLILTIWNFGIIFLISFDSGNGKDIIDRPVNFINESNLPREIRVIRTKSEQNYIIKEKK